MSAVAPGRFKVLGVTGPPAVAHLELPDDLRRVAGDQPILVAGSTIAPRPEPDAGTDDEPPGVKHCRLPDAANASEVYDGQPSRSLLLPRN